MLSRLGWTGAPRCTERVRWCSLAALAWVASLWERIRVCGPPPSQDGAVKPCGNSQTLRPVSAYGRDQSAPCHGHGGLGSPQKPKVTSQQGAKLKWEGRAYIAQGDGVRGARLHVLTPRAA